MSESATYVYAVTRGLDRAGLAAVRGVDGAAVHLVPDGDLVAVVSTVPLAEYDEEALKAKLERLDWLEEVARAHHGVVDAVTARGTALPFRLATVYRGDDRVAEVLRQGHARFAEMLDLLTGRVEIGVKVYVDPAEVAAAAPAAAEPSGSPGKDYLKRRKEQRRSRDDAWEQAAELGRRVDAGLVPYAVDVRHHRPQNPRLSGAHGENVLNAAYLVDAGDTQAFAARARKMDGAVPGTRIELTGPWAPYSFALTGKPDG
jgi:hypothetical protein